MWYIANNNDIKNSAYLCRLVYGSQYPQKSSIKCKTFVPGSKLRKINYTYPSDINNPYKSFFHGYNNYEKRLVWITAKISRPSINGFRLCLFFSGLAGNEHFVDPGSVHIHYLEYKVTPFCFAPGSGNTAMQG